MQDVTSFVKAQSPLSLVPSGESKKADSTKSTDTKSFIAIMLAQLSETSTSAKSTLKSLKESLNKEEALAKEETPILKASTDDAKSVDEHLLDDLLKIVSALKAGTTTTFFPTLTSSSNSRLEKILNSETALKDFSSVKNVNDLLALSKKYNLGLEKLNFSQEKIESLQKEFPKLTQNNFFDMQKEEQEAPKEEIKAVEKTPSISPLDKKMVQNDKPMEPSSALKDLMSKEVINKPKTEEKTTQPIKNEEIMVNEKQPIKETKIVAEETMSAKKATPTPIETVVQKITTPLIETEEKKLDKKTKSEPTAQLNKKLVTEEEVEVKTPSVTTRVNEPKIDNSTNAKGLTETILQTIKIEKPLTPKTPETIEMASPVITTTEETVSDNTETKQNNSELKVEIKTAPKQDIALKQPITSPKESLNQFANELREKIENYKPPVMKVELALNPKDLGSVDVTLLTRGSNLHVNITSNSNTMTLFTQNQAEFKNALVNMGFTNLEMNFSDQQNREQQQNQSKNTHEFSEDLGEDAFNETLTTVELVVPQYV